MASIMPRRDLEIDFSKAPCIYWSDATKISYLQRRVLVYSIMYYQFNESCVPDARYDAIVKQLVRLQKETPMEVLKKTRYHYVMYDFEGSTGFYLYSRLNRADKDQLEAIAQQVLEQWKKEN